MLKNSLSTKPLVSIIMNCHNGEKYLDQSIKSILNQLSLKFIKKEFIILVKKLSLRASEMRFSRVVNTMISTS